MSFAINVPSGNDRETTPLICSPTGKQSLSVRLYPSNFSNSGYFRVNLGYCQNLRSTIVSIMFIEYDQFVTGRIFHFKSHKNALDIKIHRLCYIT